MKRLAAALVLAVLATLIPTPGPSGAQGAVSECFNGTYPNVRLLDERDAGIYRLYCAFFLRLPDDDGFVYWHDLTSADLGDQATAFALSEEFRNTYGVLDNRGFVDLVYRNVLGRPNDGDGFNYWVGLLDKGLSRGDLMVNFSDAPEYRGKVLTPIDPNKLYYQNCTEVRADGAAPIRRGERGYGRHLDRDLDGIACEA